MTGLVHLEVVVLADDPDPDWVAENVAALGAELGDLDVDDVEPAVGGEAPEGAKGVELLAIGALLVKLQRSSRVLQQVVDAVRDWAGRTGTRTVKMTVDGDVLEISGASTGDVKQLIDAWVERHGAS